MAEISKSKKDTFRERFLKRYPDLNMEDEESYYGGANQLMDEFEGYETNSKKMRESISKSPVFAELMAAAREQDDFDPIVWMVQNKGLDLKALSEDSDYAQKLADAHNSYLEKMSKQDEIEKQMAENMPISIEAIRAKAQEMGLSDEQAEETIGRLYQIMDDLIVGKIDPTHFEMVAKGMNYNAAIEEAREEGMAAGISTKVEDKLRDLSGKNAAPRGSQRSVQEPKPKKEERNPFIA